MRIPLTELKALTEKALSNYGYNEQEIKIITDVLLYAQMRGNNQGIVKLIGRGIPNGADGEIETLKETKVSALLDAHQNHAMVSISKASDTAIQKAKESGIAVIGVNGINILPLVPLVFMLVKSPEKGLSAWSSLRPWEQWPPRAPMRQFSAPILSL